MKRLALIIFCMFSLVNVKAGNTEYVEGIIFFKTDRNVQIEDYDKNSHNSEIYNNLPVFKELIYQFDIERIYKPFKTKDKNIQLIYKIVFNETNQADELVENLKRLKFIQWAEKAQRYRLSSLPNDIDANQWYFNRIHAPDAWNIVTGQSYVKLAIVDDAVRTSHPDLLPSIFQNIGEIAGNNIDDDNNGFIDDVNGWDASDNDNDPEPPFTNFWYTLGFGYTHGTHTSGIAAAATNNGLGIASLSNGVKLIPVKCVSDNSPFPLGIENGPEGVDYAISAGADVISMSWGGATQDSVITALMTAAHNQGIVLIAAAGNDGNTTQTYPAADQHVIAVGATNRHDSIASFSQYGSFIDVIAPGDSIYSTFGGTGDYQYQSGTSMACPLTASLAALMLSHDSSYTPLDIENCLKAGADPLDSIQTSTYYGNMGAGRINAEKSIACMTPNFRAVSSFVYSSVNCMTNVKFYDYSMNADSVLWSFQGGTPSTSTASIPVVDFASAGIHTVELIAFSSLGNDTMVASVNITETIASFSAPDTVDIASGGNVSFNNTSTAGSTSQWDFGDGGTSTVKNASHTFNAAGTYTVSLTSTRFGCAAVDSQTIVVINTTGINENSLAGIKIYPNPAKDVLYIENSNNLLHFSISDILGKSILKNVIVNNTKMAIATSDLPAGIYILQLTGNDMSIRSERIIITR